MRRTGLLAAGLLLFMAAAFAGAQDPVAAVDEPPTYFEEPAEKTKFSFRWDFLARYDNVSHYRGYEELQRGRFELRPEILFEPWENFRLGVRAIFDYGTDAESIPTQDNYISRWASADRWFVQWTPGGFNIRAGRFAMPLASSELLWDRDIQTPGIAASWTSPDGAWTFAGGGFYGPQHYSDQTRIAAGQVQWRVGDPTTFQLETSLAYWYFEPRELFELYIRENTSRFENGELKFTSEFKVGDLLLRLRFPLGSVPMLISFDGLYNFEAADNQNLGYEAAVVAGQVGTPGTFRGFYVYQYIERNATMGAYNTDDWWYHTWYEGHRVGVAWTFLPQVYLQGSFSVQRRLDVHTWINRVLVDIVKIF